MLFDQDNSFLALCKLVFIMMNRTNFSHNIFHFHKQLYLNVLDYSKGTIDFCSMHLIHALYPYFFIDIYRQIKTAPKVLLFQSLKCCPYSQMHVFIRIFTTSFSISSRNVNSPNTYALITPTILKCQLFLSFQKKAWLQIHCY